VFWNADATRIFADREISHCYRPFIEQTTKMSPKEILFIFAVHSRPLKKYCGIVIENNSNNDSNIGLSARMLIKF